MECIRITAETVRRAKTELSPVFSKNTLLSDRCHIATARPLDKVWELQTVPFAVPSWMQVAIDLLADQFLLCSLHCRFCCIAIVRVGSGSHCQKIFDHTGEELLTCDLLLASGTGSAISDAGRGIVLWVAWENRSLLLSPPCYWGCCMPVVLLLVFSWSFLKTTLALNCWQKYAKRLLQHV